MADTINKSDTTIKKPKRKRLTKDDIKIVIHGLPQTPEEKKKFDQI